MHVPNNNYSNLSLIPVKSVAPLKISLGNEFLLALKYILKDACQML